MGFAVKFYLLTIFASIVVISQALPTREEVDRLINRLQQDQAREAAIYESLGIRNLDALGGGNLRRDTRVMDPYALLRYGGMKRSDPFNGAFFGDHYLKRHNDQIPAEMRQFDEMDHPNFDHFPEGRTSRENFDMRQFDDHFPRARKNFDEIDHANFDSFVKRDVSAVNKPAKAPQHFRY